ncbi:MAG: hypothetical protein IJ213_02285 [Bacteroidales bacterium]|nr:hypothetical protein [Bacteroidales bacterium]
MGQYIKILRVSWLFSLILSLLLMVIITVGYVLKSSPVVVMTAKSSTILIYIFTLIQFVLILLVRRYSKKNIKHIKEEQSIKRKLELHRQFFIKTQYLYIAANIVAFVLWIITKNYISIFYNIIALLFILTSFPYAIKAKMEMDLSEEDVEKLKNLKIVRNKNY